MLSMLPLGMVRPGRLPVYPKQNVLRTAAAGITKCMPGMIDRYGTIAMLLPNRCTPLGILPRLLVYGCYECLLVDIYW